MVKDAHQGYHATMAPSCYTNPGAVDHLIVLHHIISGGVDIVIFPSTIIDLLIKILSIPCTSAVFRSNNNILLGDQFADNVDMIGSEIAMNATVRKDDHRIFFSTFQIPGNKDVRIKLHRVMYSHAGWILDPGFRNRRPGNEYLVYKCHIPYPVVPGKVIHRLLKGSNIIPHGFNLAFQCF